MLVTPTLRACFEAALTAHWIAMSTDAAKAMFNKEVKQRRALQRTLADARSNTMQEMVDRVAHTDLPMLVTSSEDQARFFERMPAPAASAPAPLTRTSTADGGMLGGMAGRKTSVSFDDETLAILARRAEEEGMDRSAYLAQLVHRDDLRRRIAADSATLNAAGYTPDRATTLTAGLIAQRRAAS